MMPLPQKIAAALRRPPPLELAACAAPAVLLCVETMRGGGWWAAGAVAVFFAARAVPLEPSRRGRLLATTVLFVLAAGLGWGRLPVFSVTVGAMLAEIILARRRDLPMRLAAMLAVAAHLFFEIVPDIAPGARPPAPPLWVPAGLAAAAAAGWLAAAPGRAQTDIVLTAFFSLIIFSFAMATAVFAANGLSFTQSVGLAALGMTIVALFLMLLWMPFTGARNTFSGVVQAAFSLPLPMESWLAELTEMQKRAATADEFLSTAAGRLGELAKAEGVAWEIEGGAGKKTGARGGAGAHTARLNCAGLLLQIRSRRPLPPMGWFGCYLLGCALAEFYQARAAEESHTAHARMRAVHETGARITHNIKNLLHAIAGMAALLDKGDAKSVDAVRRRLPMLKDRLAGELARLQNPEDGGGEAAVPAALWWREARAHPEHAEARFVESAPAHTLPPLPAALFNDALENFLANAMNKRAAARDVQIVAELGQERGLACLRVRDTGTPLPAAAAAALFVAPVRSASGLGVGLYQLARLAAEHGYEAALEQNDQTEVRFALRAKPKARRG